MYSASSIDLSRFFNRMKNRCFYDRAASRGPQRVLKIQSFLQRKYTAPTTHDALSKGIS